jgi:peptidoglycan/LPS O-acetylase OafA/YrhL
VVVAYHAGLPVPGGFVGVDVFIVISGFVITSMLYREQVGYSRIRFGQFFLRRFKRLTPALALVVAVTMIVSIFVLSPIGSQQVAASTGIGAMLLAANFVIARTTGGYFDGPSAMNPLLNTWSLSVEDQFYLLFPAVIAFGWYLARRRNLYRLAPILLITTLATASFILAILGSFDLTFRGPNYILGFYSPITRAWEFAVGALLALFMTTHAIRAPRLMAMLGILGFTMLGASLWLINEGTPFPGIWTLLPVTATLLLLLAGSQSSTPSSRLLSSQPCVMVGDWSYSIYLWHWPFIVFAAIIWPGSLTTMLLAAAISFAPALMSYYWIEQPLRSRPLPSIRSKASFIASALAIPLACAAVLGVGASNAWWMSWSEADTSSQYDHVAYEFCTDKEFDPELCTWNEGEKLGQVLLAGDSMAYAAADGVIEAARMLGMSTVVSSLSGCGLLSLDTTGAKPYDCPTRQREIIDFALKTKPDAVLIANLSSGYVNPGWRNVIPENAGPIHISSISSLYEEGLSGVVKELYEEEIPVIIVQNVPEPDLVRAPPSILHKVFPPKVITEFDSTDALALRAQAALIEARVANKYPRTVLFDPVETLCLKSSCQLVTDGKSNYLDPRHLSREGSLLLVPQLMDSMSKVQMRN